MDNNQKRKDEHIAINLEKDVRSGLTAGFEQYSFPHRALPEIDFAQVDTSTEFLGKRLSAPVLISSMTGGTELGDQINRNLAWAAQNSGIAMGVGSQRIAIEESSSVSRSSDLRRIAPDILLFANLGAIQLNYGFGVTECKKAVDLLQADALILHLNPLQEALQKEGQTNFGGLLQKIGVICRAVEKPVIIKEVGWGISVEDARRLIEAGVTAIDVAGAGGTSWSEVEKHRHENESLYRVSSLFREWGIPTAEALQRLAAAFPDTPLISSGGLRNGLDLAKSLVMGATLGGFAGVLLGAAAESPERALEAVNEIVLELRIAMFASGAEDISALQTIKLIRR